MRRALGIAVAAAVLAGCGEAVDRPSSTPTPERPASSPTATAAGLQGATCEKQSGGDDSAAMFLSDVRVASQRGYDRVVFEFIARPGQPAKVPFFEVEPVTPPLVQDGSGEEISVEGRAYLGAVIRASGVDLSGDQPRIVYTGSDSLKPADTKAVVEVRKAGDFENTLTWYVGTNGRPCFVARTLTDPIRIVVDVEAR